MNTITINRTAGVLAAVSAIVLAAGAVFAGMLDRIVFALPAGGVTLYEAEYPGLFEDVRQIYGQTEEGEFTLRTADISGWVEGMLAHYPDEDPYHVRANTLIQFAVQILSSYGARPTDMKAHDGGEYVSASFRFTYPDSPGVPCEGVAWLNVETGRAVTLYGTVSPALSAAIGAMRFADAEEQAAWDAREPQTVDLDGLTVTFPVPATIQEGAGTRVAACLTDRTPAEPLLARAGEIEREACALEAEVLSEVNKHIEI